MGDRTAWGAALLCGLALLVAAAVDAAKPAAAQAADADAAKVDFKWGVKIPLRDGIRLNATVYLPRGQQAPAPCLFTLTPYIAQSYHDRGMYFAAHGYPFLTVDVRGRGNSEGGFTPMLQEAADGHDVVQWLARQPYCNGKVSMWGGSYAGYNQWTTAGQHPAPLATIVPAASPHPPVDFPGRKNMLVSYDIQWLTFTSGAASQDKIFGDDAFWRALYRRWYDSGAPFASLDSMLGNPSPTFQEWLAHPDFDAYWDGYNPTREQYAGIDIPVLSITGSYDGNQMGALTHYRRHLQAASADVGARHYLVIGPWDHAGTRTPKAEFGGLEFGPDSLLDLPKLHLDWYAWTMAQGPKPAFLRDKVAYYVAGAEKWRYAPSLDAVTASHRPLYLDSDGRADDVFAAGRLQDRPADGGSDAYVYDPREPGPVEHEMTDAPWITDQRGILAQRGRQLVYHSAPLPRDTEVSGFFRLQAWLAIDQPDTDFAAALYEVLADGSSVYLTSDGIRARYRESLRQQKLIDTREPLLYDFDGFRFVSRMLRKGSRIRLVVSPVDSIFWQKNYNAGGVVSQESIRDARPVTVALHHDRDRASVLSVPIGRPDPAAGTSVESTAMARGEGAAPARDNRPGNLPGTDPVPPAQASPAQTPAAAAADAAAAEDAFVAWAKAHAIPLPGPDADADGLAAIAATIGDARIVAFGEPTHGAHEPLAFRNQLLRYLVEHHGFTAIAIESGLTESRRVHDYVNGAPGDEREIVREGLTWGFGEYEENLKLMRWLRAWNADPKHARKVHLYGIDQPGGAGGTLPNARIALDELLAYFDRNAHPRARALHAALAPYLDRFTHDKYWAVPDAERQRLRWALADAAVELDRIDGTDLPVAAEADLAWARRNAATAGRLQDFFEAWPPGVSGMKIVPELVAPMEVRDSTMAEHLQWVLEREGADGRVLVFAHNAHLVDAPIRGGIWTPLGSHAPRLMGTHLRAALAEDYLILASSSAGSGEGLPEAERVQDIEAALSRVGKPHFLLDTRDARGNPALAPWLDRPKTWRANVITEIEVTPTRAFDALVYFDRLTPAQTIPAPPMDKAP